MAGLWNLGLSRWGYVQSVSSEPFVLSAPSGGITAVTAVTPTTLENNIGEYFLNHCTTLVNCFAM